MTISLLYNDLITSRDSSPAGVTTAVIYVIKQAIRLV